MKHRAFFESLTSVVAAALDAARVGVCVHSGDVRMFPDVICDRYVVILIRHVDVEFVDPLHKPVHFSVVQRDDDTLDEMSCESAFHLLSVGSESSDS